LTIENLSKSFGAVKVADDVNLSLERGETLGIIGPNGAGKTSLFNLISGNLCPARGRISFRDREVTHLSPQQRTRAGMGRTYQIPQPFSKMTVLENCLVAVDLHEANNNVLRRNQIRGGEPNLAIRGDALRAWRSNNNRVEHNVVVDHRDGLLFKYSNDNVIVGNSVANGRYGTHFMYSSGNVAQGNSYSFNTVGLFSMYSHRLCVVGNRVVHGNGPAGIGIGVKEASAIDIENNEVLGNAIGLYMDDSPFDPDEVNTVKGNHFAFNGIAVQFHNNKEGNTFSRNIFVSNLTDVAARSGGATASLWRGNYWDNYEGFDRQGKGVGNTPYEIYAYADRIWADVPMTAFYRASPVFETIDFLERLAPFSSPRLVMRDDQPLLQTPSPDNAQCGVKQ